MQSIESGSRIWDAIAQLADSLWILATELWQLGATWILLILWVVWWAAAVDWRKMWPVLGKGGWAPLALLVLVAALVWSRISPESCSCGLPVFWSHLSWTVSLVLLAMFCGWLQDVFGWAPAEVNLNPPAHHHGHGDHGHGHGHDHHHGGDHHGGGHGH